MKLDEISVNSHTIHQQAVNPSDSHQKQTSVGAARDKDHNQSTPMPPAPPVPQLPTSSEASSQPNPTADQITKLTNEVNNLLAAQKSGMLFKYDEQQPKVIFIEIDGHHHHREYDHHEIRAMLSREFTFWALKMLKNEEDESILDAFLKYSEPVHAGVFINTQA